MRPISYSWPSLVNSILPRGERVDFFFFLGVYARRFIPFYSLCLLLYWNRRMLQTPLLALNNTVKVGCVSTLTLAADLLRTKGERRCFPSSLENIRTFFKS